jgi:hypothetical protein
LRPVNIVAISATRNAGAVLPQVGAVHRTASGRLGQSPLPKCEGIGKKIPQDRQLKEVTILDRYNNAAVVKIVASD